MDMTPAVVLVVVACMFFWRLVSPEAPQLPLPNAYELQWTKAAQELGLQYANDEITGALQGCEVAVRTGYNTPTTNITVKGGGRFDHDLLLYSQSNWPGTEMGLDPEDVETHDPLFDAHVIVRGNQGRVLAVLNSKTRIAVKQFVDVGFVREGNIEILIPYVIKDSESIVKLVQRAISVAEQLTQPADAMAQALAENALKDPILEVRTRNRDCLMDLLCGASRRALYSAMKGRHPLKEETLREARHALRSKDPAQRLFAAMLVGDDASFAVLESLAGDDSLPENLRVQTLLTLTALHPWDKVRSIMASLLSSDTPEEVLRWALAAIGIERESTLVGNVCALAASVSDKVARELARTLEKLGDSAAEAALLQLLSRNDTDVRLATVQALRYVGTVRAVEPLLLVEKGRGGAELKIAVRGAIGGIQGRLGSVEAGRLSLVEQEDHAGALSIAHEQGALSLTDRKTNDKK